ncbi:MAG: hypothetical protein ACRBDI_00430 [Alphaproteobacteria bacterium]
MRILQMKKGCGIKKSLYIGLFALVSVFTGNQANAVSVIADSPCDSLYYESLSARAWLEAQREITQNQNIILKPDSVFQYTCFDRLVYELADAATNMLSETTNYGNPLASGSFEDALNDLVNETLITYVGNSFGGSGGSGGTYTLLSGHTAALGISHNPALISSGTSSAYSCDIMSRVWQAAKCINFVTNSATDGFYTFGEYAANVIDKRHLLGACTPITGNWTGNLAAALTTGPWTNDPVNTYLALTEPDSCTGGASCACTGNPIPTGLRVVNSANPTGYDEHICLQPGCRYKPATTGSSSTSAGCYAN